MKWIAFGCNSKSGQAKQYVSAIFLTFVAELITKIKDGKKETGK